VITNWQTLSSTDYANALYNFFVDAETRNHTTPDYSAYLDSRGFLSIGVGFNLTTSSVQNAVFDALGLIPNDSALANNSALNAKVDTFPFQRYGSLKGTLISIRPDAEDKNAASRDTDTRAGAGSQQSDPSHDPANSSSNAGYVYKVHIRTEQSHFVVAVSRTPSCRA
jgi:hypothetical protein